MDHPNVVNENELEWGEQSSPNPPVYFSERASEGSELRLEGLYLSEASDPRTHLQMVWRMSLGDSVGEVMVGYSEKWTTHGLREGVEGLSRHGNPGAKERALDEEGQARLREALLEEAAGRGMWSGPKVARWIEEETGMERVHAQRGWEYLRKVGMSPQVPRPSNAKGAEASEREAFKSLPTAEGDRPPGGGAGGALGRGRGSALKPVIPNPVVYF